MSQNYSANISYRISFQYLILCTVFMVSPWNMYTTVSLLCLVTFTNQWGVPIQWCSIPIIPCCMTCTRALLWLFQCQWSNSVEYGQLRLVTNKFKLLQNVNRIHISWCEHTHYIYIHIGPNAAIAVSVDAEYLMVLYHQQTQWWYHNARPVLCVHVCISAISNNIFHQTLSTKAGTPSLGK